MFSSAEDDAEPALLVAKQVYEPRCSCMTEFIIKRLVFVPKLLVVIPEAESELIQILMLFPSNVHLICIASSPSETLHSILS